MPSLNDLLKQDSERMAKVEEAVKAALTVIDDVAEDHQEHLYMTYKVGARLLFIVLEEQNDRPMLAKAVLQSDGSIPFPSQTRR